jgi:hypothetical protein
MYFNIISGALQSEMSVYFIVLIAGLRPLVSGPRYSPAVRVLPARPQRAVLTALGEKEINSRVRHFAFSLIIKYFFLKVRSSRLSTYRRSSCRYTWARKYVPGKHYKEFCAGLKAVYSAPGPEAAGLAFGGLEEKWGGRLPRRGPRRARELCPCRATVRLPGGDT